MRYFMTVMGIIITLLFLLAILAGAARVSGAAPSAENAELKDGTSLIFLPIMGGTALLAGVVWLGTLRRAQEAHQLTVEENRKSISG